MIVEFDKEYEQKIIKNGLPSGKCSDGLIKLFNEAAKGVVYIRASIDFLNFLKRNVSKRFSDLGKGYLYKLIEKYVTWKNDYKEIPTLFMIVEKNVCELSQNCYGRLTLDDLPDNFTSELYCENNSDSNFYVELFKRIKKPFFEIKIRCRNYGGSGAKNTIYDILKEREIPFLSIADSDKEYSDHSGGGTAKVIRELYEKNNHDFSTYYILKVREKENLVPAILICNLSCYEDNVKKLLKSLSTADIDQQCFFDIKSGLTAKKRKEFKNDEKWRAINSPIIKKMQKRKAFHNVKDGNLIDGMNDCGIAKIFNSDIDYNSFLTYLNKTQREDIVEIFNQLIRFGCAVDCFTN